MLGPIVGHRLPREFCASNPACLEIGSSISNVLNLYQTFGVTAQIEDFFHELNILKPNLLHQTFLILGVPNQGVLGPMILP